MSEKIAKNEFDFSALKAVATPESWIENALNIPQKKKPLPFFLRPYVIGAAASLVIVAAVLFTAAVNQGGNKPFRQPEDVFVATPVQETTEGEAYPTELVPVTDAEGEVIGTAAVPVTRRENDDTEASSPSASTVSPGTADQTTVPATTGVEPKTTVPATQPATHSATEGATQPATQAATVPATETLTEPNEAAGEDDVQPETDAQDTTAGETTAPEEFKGSFTLCIYPENPLFDSTYVRLEFYDRNGSLCGGVLILKPKLSGAGCKSVTFYPSSNGITLYRWQTFALRVYDTNGNSSAVSVTPTFPEGVTVRI